MAIGAFISGCAGTQLSGDEESFLRDANPWGLILFARNIDDPEQVLRLTSRFREITGRDDAPVLIDQEGGRVQRMRPPHWSEYPAARKYSELYDRFPVQALKLVRLFSRMMADDLERVGINVDCLPVLDVPHPGSHEIIGDRAYGVTPERVSILSRSAVAGLMDGGVLGVIKHIPGHGRALSDSHKELPVVDTGLDELSFCDFVPFAALADIPMAMTAHVVYSQLDPDNPATMSRLVIEDLIRTGIGYDGLLMSDDLSMQALKGDFRLRAQGSIAAGCDVTLHCNGDMNEMIAVAEGSGQLAGNALRRAEAALASITTKTPFDRDYAMAELASFMGGCA